MFASGIAAPGPPAASPTGAAYPIFNGLSMSASDCFQHVRHHLYERNERKKSDHEKLLPLLVNKEHATTEHCIKHYNETLQKKLEQQDRKKASMVAAGSSPLPFGASTVLQPTNVSPEKFDGPRPRNLPSHGSAPVLNGHLPGKRKSSNHSVQSISPQSASMTNQSFDWTNAGCGGSGDSEDYGTCFDQFCPPPTKHSCADTPPRGSNSSTPASVCVEATCSTGLVSQQQPKNPLTAQSTMSMPHQQQSTTPHTSHDGGDNWADLDFLKDLNLPLLPGELPAWRDAYLSEDLGDLNNLAYFRDFDPQQQQQSQSACFLSDIDMKQQDYAQTSNVVLSHPQPQQAQGQATSVGAARIHQHPAVRVSMAVTEVSPPPPYADFAPTRMAARPCVTAPAPAAQSGYANLAMPQQRHLHSQSLPVVHNDPSALYSNVNKLKVAELQQSIRPPTAMYHIVDGQQYFPSAKSDMLQQQDRYAIDSAPYGSAAVYAQRAVQPEILRDYAPATAQLSMPGVMRQTSQPGLLMAQQPRFVGSQPMQQHFATQQQSQSSELQMRMQQSQFVQQALARSAPTGSGLCSSNPSLNADMRTQFIMQQQQQQLLALQQPAGAPPGLRPSAVQLHGGYVMGQGGPPNVVAGYQMQMQQQGHGTVYPKYENMF